MCVIINIPKDITIPKHVMKACYENNPHGWGIMYPEAGRLITVKDVSPYEDFIERFDAIPDNVPRAIHFRIRTHGATNKENCHPFIVLDNNIHGMDLGMMHNGVLSTVAKHKDMSDTYNFVEEVLKPILTPNTDMINNPAFRQLLEDYAGTSKLVFFDGEGNSMTINAELGHNAHGAWFSNSHSLLEKPATVYYPKNTYTRVNHATYAAEYGYSDDYDYCDRELLPRKTVYSAGAACVANAVAKPVADLEEDTEEVISPAVKEVVQLCELMFLDGDANITWQELEDRLRGLSPKELEEFVAEDCDLAAMVIQALIN